MESFPVTEKLAFLFLISQKRVLYFNRKISQKSFTFQVNWEKKERERWYFLCYLTLFLTFDKKSCLGWWSPAEDPIKHKSSKKLPVSSAERIKKWQQHAQQLSAITVLSVPLSFFLLARLCFINLITALSSGGCDAWVWEWWKEQHGREIPPTLHFSNSKHGNLLNNILIARSSRAFVDQRLIFIFSPLQQNSGSSAEHISLQSPCGGEPGWREVVFQRFGEHLLYFQFQWPGNYKTLLPPTLFIFIKTRQV